MGDPLPEELAEAFAAVRPELSPRPRLLFFDKIGSTNDIALTLAAQADAEGTIVIADQQTSGRGRFGRVWHSPPRSGLYVSMVLWSSRGRPRGDRATGLVNAGAGGALAAAACKRGG